jgi:uncharacterized membrane protein
MDKNKLPLTVFAAAVALCLLQAHHYAAILPPRVASHFGPSGQPNAWMARDRFLSLYLGVVGLTSVLFALIAFVVVRAAPSSINLPNKEYWLAPERRAETADYLAGAFLWFGAATDLLMFDVFRQTFRYDLGQAPALEHPLASLGVYAAFGAAWSVAFLRKFSKPPVA